MMVDADILVRVLLKRVDEARDREAAIILKGLQDYTEYRERLAAHKAYGIVSKMLNEAIAKDGLIEGVK
jgi:hypothetical protein